MEQMSRSARHLLHISEVGGATGVDFSKLSPDLLSLVPHRLVEADDMPTDLTAGSIAGVVTALASITPMPPRRAGLDAETNARPCDVDVDGLAGPKSDRMLANGNRESGFVDRAEDIVFESTLRRSFLSESTVEPSLQGRHAVLASAAMSLEVAGSSRGSHQAEVPRILRRTFESVLVEVGREPEEHAERSCDEQSVLQPLPVTVGVEPLAPPYVDPIRNAGAASGRRRDVYGRLGHPPQSREPGRGPR
jgi:hypothetical protein